MSDWTKRLVRGFLLHRLRWEAERAPEAAIRAATRMLIEANGGDDG